MTIEPSLKNPVDAALKDAASRTGLDASRLRVVFAQAVTWPDGSAGCPEPGMAYAQALVDGYLIRIVAGDATLEYHGSRRGKPFLCPAARITPPSSSRPSR